MKNTFLALMLTILSLSLFGQDKILPGTFQHDNLTFTILDLRPRLHQYKVYNNKSFNYPPNPDIIDKLPFEYVVESLVISNIIRYKTYLDSLPNHDYLGNKGEKIDILYVINGSGKIIDLVFDLPINTNLTKSNIKGLYDYIMANEKLYLKSYKNSHVGIKFYMFTRTYDFANLGLL